MSTHADEIRSYAGRFVDQARREGLAEVSIVVGQIVRELHLNNRTPAVCSALASKRFQELNRVVLARREGPRSGQSTTTRFTYRLTDSDAQANPSLSSFSSLRGIGKEALESLGGGEAFLRRERDQFGGL